MHESYTYAFMHVSPLYSHLFIPFEKMSERVLVCSTQHMMFKSSSFITVVCVCVLKKGALSSVQ